MAFPLSNKFLMRGINIEHPPFSQLSYWTGCKIDIILFRIFYQSLRLLLRCKQIIYSTKKISLHFWSACRIIPRNSFIYYFKYLTEWMDARLVSLILLTFFRKFFPFQIYTIHFWHLGNSFRLAVRVHFSDPTHPHLFFDYSFSLTISTLTRSPVLSSII